MGVEQGSAVLIFRPSKEEKKESRPPRNVLLALFNVQSPQDRKEGTGSHNPFEEYL